ncbi:MAG: hypothetical protein R6W90_04810 [Ignavibacteriaceae bacterium]
MIFKKNGHVRRNTDKDINRRIDQEIEARVRYLSLKGRYEIDSRLNELDKEWDIERTLEVNAGTLALTGVALAAMHDKKWLILPAIITTFLIQHAVQGWCPPLPLFRKMGIRTKAEIDKEKMALKAIRGDFNETSSERDDLKRADKALKAVLAE